jgi:hypothetical protein
MTTIACNGKEIAADSRCTEEGIGGDAYSVIKLFANDEAIYGVTGGNCTGSLTALAWLQSTRNEPDKPMPPDYDHEWDWRLIELSSEGIAIYNERLERELSTDMILAVGSGRKVALYCMKYLHMTPAEAVREACKIDHHSELPIYTASLADLTVRKWAPPARKRKTPTPPVAP